MRACCFSDEIQTSFAVPSLDGFGMNFLGRGQNIAYRLSRKKKRQLPAHISLICFEDFVRTSRKKEGSWSKESCFCPIISPPTPVNIRSSQLRSTHSTSPFTMHFGFSSHQSFFFWKFETAFSIKPARNEWRKCWRVLFLNVLFKLFPRDYCKCATAEVFEVKKLGLKAKAFDQAFP